MAGRARYIVNSFLESAILSAWTTCDHCAPKKPAPKPRRDRTTRRRIVIAVIAAVVVLVLAFGSRILGLYVDWLWFGEVGFRGVFWTRFWAQLLLGLAAFAAFFVVIWVNVEIGAAAGPDFRADVDGTLLEPRSPAVRRLVGIGGAVVCVMVAFIAGVSASGAWQQVLLYFNQTTVRRAGRAVRSRHRLLRLLHAVLAGRPQLRSGRPHHLAGARRHRPPHHGRHRDQAEAGPEGGGAAGETGSIPFARGQQAPQIPQIDLKLGGRAVAHLSALLAAVFVVVGIGQLFKGWNLVYSAAGAIYGAGYTDVVVRLPMARVTMVIAFALAAVLVWNVWRRRQWWPLTIVVWVVALILLRGVVPAVYQSLIVNPNQLSKERDYIARNLEATKKAFDLEAIVQKPLDTKEALTPKKLSEN